MGFFRSSFLFVYNIPSFVTEHMVSSNIRKLEYVKFLPQFYDNMRCGFALVEIDESRMSTSETEQVTADVLSRIRAKNFSGQTIEVDEVWFKSAGNDSEPPQQDLLKSNFIFVYNLPSNGYTQTELESLTQSNNVIFLPEIDEDTRCAFVELPELSENDWNMLLSTIRRYTRRSCQFSVDEIWLNPVNEDKLMPPPIIPEPVPQSQVPLVRDYQPPPPNILTAPMSQPPVTPYGPPGWAPVPGMPRPLMPNIPNMQLRPSSAVVPVKDSKMVETPEIVTVKRILTGKSLRDRLSTLLDEEIRALGEFVNTNMHLMQAQVQVQNSPAIPMFFENIQIIHAEHCSRRNGCLPLTGMDKESLQRALVLATSKVEMTNSLGFMPATSLPRPMHERPVDTGVKSEGEPSAKRYAPAESVKASEVTEIVETETTYLFVNRIPKSMTLIQLLSGVPCVDNFVFSESNDENTKSGFAFLKSSSDSVLEEVVQAFRKNGPGIDVFRVRLEPILVGKASYTQTSKNDGNSQEVPAPPVPPQNALIQFSLGNGNRKPDTNSAKDESRGNISIDEVGVSFMQETGFNDELAPIVYCVEVRGMPINTTETQFSKVVKDRVSRIHEYCLLTDSSNKSRRALFFGGSREEATALQSKLKSLLQTVHHKLDIRVLLTNRPDTLAPLPQRLTTEIKSRRILLSNLPDWPVELLLMRIGKFAPKAAIFMAPRAADQAGTSLGHIYLGYESHEQADADMYRLNGWKLTSNDTVSVQLVVDTGWGKNGPLIDQVGNCRQLERIIRYRREVGADKVKLHYISDRLVKYKAGPTVPSHLHQTLGQYIYEGALENLYAMVIRRLPMSLDMDNFIKRIVKGKLFGLEASSMISNTGEHKEVIVFFGSRDGAVVDNACSAFRELVSTRNRDFMAVVQECRITPEIERHLGDTFVPVTKDFAMRRGCQFLIFSNIPPETGKVDCLYGLRSLCPNARSFYVPTGPGPSGPDTGKVLGYAVARFNDPRQCRAAFLALSPTCTLAGSTIRVSFAALHKVLSTTYQDRSYSVPLHVWYSWLRYSPESVSNEPWVLDNTSRSPFFCTCHHVVLPFKPTQFKGFTGRKSK